MSLKLSEKTHCFSFEIMKWQLYFECSDVTGTYIELAKKIKLNFK